MKKGTQVMRTAFVGVLIAAAIILGAIAVYAETRGTHTADEILVNYQGREVTLDDAIKDLGGPINAGTVQGVPEGYVETPVNLNEDAYGVLTSVAGSTIDTCDKNKGSFFNDVAANGIQDFGRFVCQVSKENGAGCTDVFLTTLYIKDPAGSGKIIVSPQYAKRTVTCRKAFSLVKISASSEDVPPVPTAS